MTRDFLNHFEVRQRGHIANLFLDPVRRGQDEPHRIVSAVRHEALLKKLKYQRWGNVAGVQRMEHIVLMIDFHFSEALDYASWAVWWESLSAEERRRLKAERWMAEQPATEKQTNYLRSLGYAGEIESKLQASELIDRLLKEERSFV